MSRVTLIFSIGKLLKLGREEYFLIGPLGGCYYCMGVNVAGETSDFPGNRWLELLMCFVLRMVVHLYTEF